MFNLDPGKLLIIGVVGILLLGPDRLPQVARQVGGAWRTLNQFRHRMESEVRSNIPDLPSTSDISRMVRSPSALLNHLGSMSPDGTAAVSSESSGSNESAPTSAEWTVAGQSSVPTDAAPSPSSPARPVYVTDVAMAGDANLN